MEPHDQLPSQRQKLIYGLAAASLLLSFAMLMVGLAGVEIKIWPMIVGNWIAFMATTLAIHRIGRAWQGNRISRPNHNLWRLVILAFAGCGFAAIAAGAQIV